MNVYQRIMEVLTNVFRCTSTEENVRNHQQRGNFNRHYHVSCAELRDTSEDKQHNSGNFMQPFFFATSSVIQIKTLNH